MIGRNRVNSLANLASISSSNELRTQSRAISIRARSNSVNVVEPEQFNAGIEVSSPVTFKKKIAKLGRIFKPLARSWSGDSNQELYTFDASLIELANLEGQKLLSADVHLKDESYKDRGVFKMAIENKERFIAQLIESAKLEFMTNDSHEPLYDKTLINMIKRYLEPIIGIFLDRRNPEYLLLIASSPCTRQLLASKDITGRLHRFKQMLNDSIQTKDVEMFKTALEFGMGAAVQTALILANGSDIINYESFMWASDNLKAVLENQEIPIGFKYDARNLYAKRYSECSKLFTDSNIRAILTNGNSSMYNRMRKFNSHFTNGGVHKRMTRRRRQ